MTIPGDDLSSRFRRPFRALPHGHRIRPMRVTDLSSVHRIECTSQDHPWTLQQFRDEFTNPAAKVDLYLCDDRPAGFICSWLIAGELQIQNIATAPEFRRQGVGAHLLEHVLARSRDTGLEAAWLEVRADNTAAIALYERFGFRQVDRRPKYYKDGSDALIMTYQPGGETS